MAMKKWFRKMQPVQLYIILLLTTALFVTEMTVSYFTHSLTLLMDAYHMMCNIMALTACIVTIKKSKPDDNTDCDMKKTHSVSSSIGEELSSNPAACHDKKKPATTQARAKREKNLRNTFGWARIDVISMLSCCVFLWSLCFSVCVEALQTLFHIDHQDEMHYPISVLCLGACGLLLNGVCYLLIGGYTFHQGSFLYLTESGDVILNKIVVDESVKRGERRLSRTKTIHSTVLPPRERQGLWEMGRDICGCVIVIITALLVFFTDPDIAKFLDPLMALVSVTLMVVLSCPYMKESCLILLQTMPDTINIDSLKAELQAHFPDIVNVHDLHVWQLTASKIISTVHIIFQNPKVYNKIMEDVTSFFTDKGITQVTIQPEFFTNNVSMESLDSKKFAPNCLMSCLEVGCKESHCCPDYEEPNLFKSSSKQMIQENQAPELKSIKILTNELSPPKAKNGKSPNGKKNYEDIKLKNEINSSLTDISLAQEAKSEKSVECDRI